MILESGQLKSHKKRWPGILPVDLTGGTPTGRLPSFERQNTAGGTPAIQ